VVYTSPPEILFFSVSYNIDPRVRVHCTLDNLAKYPGYTACNPVEVVECIPRISLRFDDASAWPLVSKVYLLKLSSASQESR